jgi:hypothetical protein
VKYGSLRREKLGCKPLLQRKLHETLQETPNIAICRVSFWQRDLFRERESTSGFREFDCCLRR